jgi:hypothetical protein
MRALAKAISSPLIGRRPHVRRAPEPRPERRHASLQLVFHVELRQFPHTACAFNLSGEELLALVVPWSREQWVELGERKWSPHRARLTVLEGPHLPVEDLAMGRGWGNAQRRGRDVTERVIAQARASQQGGEAAASGGDVAASDPGGVAPGGAPAPVDVPVAAAAPAAGSPELELSPLLGSDPAALLQAWRLASERRPELAPSEALALAERTLRSLDASSA